jgi:alkaline phosphatase D
VLWTRLAPEPLSPNPQTPGGMRGGDVTVGYEIATDSALRDVVRRGEATAEQAFAYSVHLDVRGLQPDRPYWYRFTSGEASSRIGRAATLPSADATPERVRFAFASCANYEHGYFSAYRLLADENPEFVLFLGDYIYETIEEKRPTVRRTASKRRRCLPIATAMRNIGSMRTCSGCMRKCRPMSPGTTTRCRTTTATNGRSVSTTRKCS